ncbi:MAG: NUDIX domain-containing protein [Lachnospiraceae bacterium]|nr:NUDIX domain-containing protein [Lachnospiraceae bacterium]
MSSVFVHIKAIVEQNGQYLILKHWVDDRIVDPYSWEFLDTELERGESPEQAALRVVMDNTGVSAKIADTLYTWTNMLGDHQIVGIAFLVHLDEEDPELSIGEDYCGYKWITPDQFSAYIDNRNVLQDLKNIWKDKGLK